MHVPVQTYVGTCESRPPSPFAAPERQEPAEFDMFHADVYALGKILAFLFYGAFILAHI
jgi:hypothetical protein